MNKFLKIILGINISGVIISLFISGFSEGNTLLAFTDCLFYFGLFILTVGIFLYVSGNGFFDFFRWSSQRVFTSYGESYENYKNSISAYPVELGLAKYMILSGTLIIIITFIIAKTMF